MAAGVDRLFLVRPGDFSVERSVGVLAALAILLLGTNARGADAGSTPALRKGEPPNVAPAAPGWNEADRSTYDFPEAGAPAERRPLGVHAWLGVHTLFAGDRVMPGFDLRIGKRPLWFDAEVSCVWSTRSSPERDSSFLGNHVGAFFMVAPFRYRWFELRAGLGGDFFPLWNTDASELQSALSLRGSAHVRLWPRIELFGTARGFLAESSELGMTRNDHAAQPFLFSLGLAWRTQ